jgi:hypothetical protein
MGVRQWIGDGGKAVAIERNLEVVLKGFHGHDALVFTTRSAHAGIEGDLVVAEATYEVAMESVHLVPFYLGTTYHRGLTFT